MTMDIKLKISQEQLHAIMLTLNKGNRVELIPTENSVKVLEIKRKEIKTN